MKNVRAFESLGSKDLYSELQFKEFADRLSNHALRFVMNGGVVTHISPSVESTQADVLNIQRGVLSMLQVRQVKERTILRVTEVSSY